MIEARLYTQPVPVFATQVIGGRADGLDAVLVQFPGLNAPVLLTPATARHLSACLAYGCVALGQGVRGQIVLPDTFDGIEAPEEWESLPEPPELNDGN